MAFCISNIKKPKKYEICNKPFISSINIPSKELRNVLKLVGNMSLRETQTKSDPE